MLVWEETKGTEGKEFRGRRGRWGNKRGNKRASKDNALFPSSSLMGTCRRGTSFLPTMSISLSMRSTSFLT